MALSALVRVLFQDTGAKTGLDELNARLRRIEYVGGPGARRGLALVQNGMRGLAFQAVGLRGPLGQVSEALLQLGGGKGATLVAAAGLGALALAYRALDKPVREASATADAFTKSLLAQADATRTLNDRFGTLIGQLERAKVLARAQGLGVLGGLGAALQNVPFASAATAGVARITRSREGALLADQVRAAIALSKLEVANAAKEAREQAEKERKARLIQAENMAMGIAGEIFTVNQRLRAGIAPLRGPRRLTPAPVTPEAPPPSSQPTFGQGLTSALYGFGDFAASVRLGGIGGGLQNLGGIIGAGVKFGDKTLLGAMPGLGAVLSVGGGLFSLFDRSEERRHKELIDAINKQGRESGLQRVSIVLPNGQRLNLSELVSAETHDAVARVPGFAGTTG